MATLDLLKEYVLNDTGFLFRGSSFWISAYPWSYAQVSDVANT